MGQGTHQIQVGIRLHIRAGELRIRKHAHVPYGTGWCTGAATCAACGGSAVCGARADSGDAQRQRRTPGRAIISDAACPASVASGILHISGRPVDQAVPRMGSIIRVAGDGGCLMAGLPVCRSRGRRSGSCRSTWRRHRASIASSGSM